MSQIEYSSIPAWARPAEGARPQDADIDLGGSSYLLIGVGSGAGPILQKWTDLLAPGPATMRRVEAAGAAEAQTAMREALDTAKVGLRVLVAAPVGDCLALRGVASAAGLLDDELHFSPTGPGPLEVYCAHCGAVTSAVAAVDDIVACTGCERKLLVYYHVSRRTGQYLGFMADAEEPSE